MVVLGLKAGMDRIGAFRRAQAILNKFRRTGVTVDSMVRFLRHLLDIGAWRQLEAGLDSMRSGIVCRQFACYFWFIGWYPWSFR